MNGNAVRINISLPLDLVKDLKQRTSPRGFSKFLAEAAEEKIKAMEQEKAFKEILEAPATFTKIKDSTAWIRKMRRLDEKRLKRLGV